MIMLELLFMGGVAIFTGVQTHEVSGIGRQGRGLNLML